jgi:starvation-inducible DNA-binding protein
MADRYEPVYLEGALMYKSKIDLPEKVRRNVILILNDRLADAIDLQSQVKQAHWNVKGHCRP